MKVQSLMGAFAFAVLMAGSPAQAQIGIKNFRQIIQSFNSLTGVMVTDPDVKATIEETRSRLPKFGRADEVNSAMLLAMTSLSGIFCQKLIAADAQKSPDQRRAHKSVDFAKIPSS